MNPQAKTERMRVSFHAKEYGDPIKPFVEIEPLGTPFAFLGYKGELFLEPRNGTNMVK